MRERSPRTGILCEVSKPHLSSERDYSVRQEIQRALQEEIGKAMETLADERAENGDKNDCMRHFGKHIHEKNWYSQQCILMGTDQNMYSSVQSRPVTIVRILFKVYPFVLYCVVSPLSSSNFH